MCFFKKMFFGDLLYHFEGFLKNKVIIIKKWEVALRRDKFTASDSSVLCSKHFMEANFDRTSCAPQRWCYSFYLELPKSPPESRYITKKTLLD